MNLASVLAIKISHAKEMKVLYSNSKSKLNNFYSLSVKGVIEAINYVPAKPTSDWGTFKSKSDDIV